MTAPDEPGFFLEQVPVQTAKQVWAILEVRKSVIISTPRRLDSHYSSDQVVREQCWLNETIKGCDWISEDPDSVLPTDPKDAMEISEDATEAELQAVLGGMAPTSLWHSVSCLLGLSRYYHTTLYTCERYDP